jgi:hypothetical protein
MMRRSIPALMLSAAAAVGLVLAGAAPAQAAPSPTVQVDIAASGAIHMRHSLPAGYIKFDVDGADGHTLQLVKPKHHASVDQLVTDTNAFSSTGKATGLERDFTAMGGSLTQTDLWVRLPHGRYYAIDIQPTTLTKQHVVVLHVGAGHAVADRPHVGAVITAVDEMRWAKSPKHIPSHGVLAFLNESTDYHFIVLLQVKPGTTLAEVKESLMSPGQPSFALSGNYSTGVLSPGNAQLSTYSLPKGKYVLACFWPDENGVPHAAMGMLRFIHIG